jgi:hypothetical protein
MQPIELRGQGAWAADATAIRLDEWRSMGIVGMHQALQDGASGAEEVVRQKGLGRTEEALREQYWCTLCGCCCRIRAAREHKKKHSHKYADPARRDGLETKLDEKYGDFLLQHACRIWCNRLVMLKSIGPMVSLCL